MASGMSKFVCGSKLGPYLSFITLGSIAGHLVGKAVGFDTVGAGTGAIVGWIGTYMARRGTCKI